MNETLRSISTGSVFKMALVALFFFFLWFFRDLILVLLTAIVIASAIEPLTRWLARWRIPRIIAVIFIYLAFTGGIVSVFYFFLPPLINDTVGILNAAPRYLETANETFGGNLFSNETLGGTLPEGLPLRDAIVNIRDIVSGASGGIIQTISAVFGGLFSFILILVISFYLAVQERGIENFLRLVTPVSHEKYVVGLWKRSQRKIGLWMQGQLLLGLIVGVLVYLGLTVLQVKYALLLAVLAAFFEIIPLFGPILAATPAVILGFLDSFSLGFMVLGLYVIIQQFENHLIYPLVVRKVVGVPPILVIIALLVGGKLAGFLGIILAVPIASALMEFAEDIQKEKSALAEKESKKQ